MTASLRLIPYGDRAILVELDDALQVPACAAAIRSLKIDAVIDIVPAARTVLVVFDHRHTTSRAIATLLASAAILEQTIPAEPGPMITLDVVYDGEDLDAVAHEIGMSTRELVRLHTATTYHSVFCGFAPGFAYLAGGDPRLEVPRLVTPRTRVPAGSVAIAAGWCGVYPREMPGGWRLLGHTDVALWDLGWDPPALLAPGSRVRFRERAA